MRIPQTPPAQAAVTESLEAANLYFRMKADAVLENSEAIELLAELYQVNSMNGEDLERLGIEMAFGIPKAVALAMLAAAGFCDVNVIANEPSVTITTAGIEFIDFLLRGGQPHTPAPVTPKPS